MKSKGRGFQCACMRAFVCVCVSGNFPNTDGGVGREQGGHGGDRVRGRE